MDLPSLKQGLKFKHRTQNIYDNTKQISNRFQSHKNNEISSIPFLPQLTKKEGFVTNNTINLYTNKDALIPVYERDTTESFSNIYDQIKTDDGQFNNTSYNISATSKSIQDNIENLIKLDKIDETNYDLAQGYLQAIESGRDNIMISNSNIKSELDTLRTNTLRNSFAKELSERLSEYEKIKNKAREFNQVTGATAVALHEEMKYYNFLYLAIGVSIMTILLIIKYKSSGM